MFVLFDQYLVYYDYIIDILILKIPKTYLLAFGV